jgi:hypothetical protein
MPNYYRKEIPESPVYVKGAPMSFDFLETSDPTLIAEFTACIRGQRGGIIEMTKEEYESEIKKKENGIGSESSFRPRMRQQGLSAFNLQGRRAAVPDGSAMLARPQIAVGKNDSQVSGRPMPDPIQVPSPGAFKGAFKRPPTGKMPDPKL